MIQIIFAFLAGILTIAAPCILPMLPILLGASVGQNSKQRPLFIVLGFIVSFSALSLVLSAIIQNLGLSPNFLRDIAVIALAIFAGIMLYPKPFEAISSKFSGVINRAGQIGSSKSGNIGGLILGFVLGIIWTPCAGPILASILVLIATQGSGARSAVLLIAYAAGAGIPMLVIAYGSQYITTKVRGLAKYSVLLQQIFGVLILLLAIAMFFQYDTKIQAALVEKFPAVNLENYLVGQNGNPINNKINSENYSDTDKDSGAEKIPANIMVPDKAADSEKGMPVEIDFKNYGPAPQFSGIEHWLNLSGQEQTLNLSSLKGKVVLVDFWTYTCINCIRTLPYVTKWYDTYKDKGFVVIGVHTPEFAFEKSTGNVQTAINHFGINYPVAQDNNYSTWAAYNNQYWPAEYLIDQKGNIVYEHFGEGNYDLTETAILQLLGLNESAGAKNPAQNNVQSPEMYFGTDRLKYLSSQQTPSPTPANYYFGDPDLLALNTFALEGAWQFSGDSAKLVKPNGKIRLHFSSGKIFMVASSEKPVTLHITVDGKTQADVVVQASQLYTLFDSSDYSEHTIEIEIPDSGFSAFTFTFG
jgi:cytochrome c biogenesis protein CcdA/thiol-disulfide isomerase/thioredoxin